jgi:hypothetical protein
MKPEKRPLTSAQYVSYPPTDQSGLPTYTASAYNPSYGSASSSSAPPLLTSSYSTSSPSQAILKKLDAKNPNIAKLAGQARQELYKRGLDKQKFRVAFVLDISGSMKGLFENKFVTELAEHLLALTAFLDDNGEIEVFPFATNSVQTPVVINAETDRDSLHQALLDCFNNNPDCGRGTNYSKGLQNSREYYQAQENRTPVLRYILTDGENVTDPERFYTEAIESSNDLFIDKYMVITSDKNLDNFSALDWADNGPVIADPRPAYENVPEALRRTHDNIDVKNLEPNYGSGQRLKDVTFDMLIDEVLESLISMARIGILGDEELTYDRTRATEFAKQFKTSADAKGEISNIEFDKGALATVQHVYKARKQNGNITDAALAIYNPEFVRVHEEAHVQIKTRSSCCLVM